MNVSRQAISTITAVVVVIVIIALAVGGYYALTSTGPSSSSSSSSSSSTSTSYSLSAPVTITAGGSSFVNPIMQVWASGFHNTTTSAAGVVTINYASVGSSAGKNGLYAGTFAYAGSDAPVTGSTLTNYTNHGGPLLQIPETLGAVAIFYNVPGLTNSTCSSSCVISLNLNSTDLAQIYLQNITNWDDPMITQNNPGVTIPSTLITPVHRSDGSGTTYAFTDYLSKAYAAWNSSSVGQGTSVNWPPTELGAKGSSGVAGDVTETPGAIGYADTYYAFKNGLTTAAIKNSAGNYVQPTLTSIASAASDFSTQLASNPIHDIVNPSGSGSYPISTFTYLLVWENQTTEANAYTLAHFFYWIVTTGQTYAPNLYYATLPLSMVTTDEQLIAEINFQGQTFTTP